MKAIKRTILAFALALSSCFGANAQYYDIANQAVDMIQTIFAGGASYRGLFDVGYMKGLGPRRADFLEFSTTQGVLYAKWFYMGVGAGADVLYAHSDQSQWLENTSGKSMTTTAVTIPLFSDFRFIIGKEAATRFFIDLRVGASFLVGKNGVAIGDGYLNRAESFYFKPSIGLRIPLSSTSNKYAMNVGVSYHFLTNNDWWWQSSYNSISLSSLGATIGFEW